MVDRQQRVHRRQGRQVGEVRRAQSQGNIEESLDAAADTAAAAAAAAASIQSATKTQQLKHLSLIQCQLWQVQYQPVS